MAQNTPDLNKLRQEIDRTDRSIIKSLKTRFSLVRKVGQTKKKQNIPPLDKNRWKQVLTSRLSWADKAGVDKDFTKQFFDLIHAQALKIEDNEK